MKDFVSKLFNTLFMLAASTAIGWLIHLVAIGAGLALTVSQGIVVVFFILVAVAFLFAPSQEAK